MSSNKEKKGFKKNKTFKEKKIFYQERQKFFDAVKLARNDEYPIITYKKEQYKLVSLDNMKELPNITEDGYGYGYAVMFNNSYKSNQVVEFHYGNRNNLSVWGDNCWVRYDFSRILCYAIKMNKHK